MVPGKRGQKASRPGWGPVAVNWVSLQIVDAKGVVKYSMAWVTSLPVSKHSIAGIAACGRARWKIGNEGFNVMKNHGYELGHSFGHGERFLAMHLAALNLLAFAWHTVPDILEPPWIAARQAAGKRTAFFTRLHMLTACAIFPARAVLINSLTTFTIPPELLNPRKIQ